MAREYYRQWSGEEAGQPFGPEWKLVLPWLKLLGIPVIVVLWFLSGIYIVRTDEQGVVRRFGRAVRVTQPGPHYHFPRPIEKVDRVKVTKVRRIEIGFRSISSGTPARYRFVPQESLMLTGDEQIVDAQMIIQYKVKESKKFLFNVRDLESPRGALMDAAEVALRQVVGRRPIDDVLIGEKLQIEKDILELLQRIIDRYDSGVKITAAKLQTVRPPKEVEKAFSDVVSAKEDKERLVKEADGYREDLLPKARGEAQRIIREAEAYKAERIKRAQGDADRFLAVLKEYEKAKEVTRKRLYLEAMENVLPNVRKFIIDPELGNGPLQILPLEGTIKKLQSQEKGH
ncbi:MAG: FtsH protease activity modulator HflK [Sedimentisphaerales bacterium]|nr:FtsH protease activity modulator HflK [Sedimentisphaerales bacterium]